MDSYETDETVRRAMEFLDSISRPFTFDDCDNVYVHVDEKGIRRLVSIPPRDDEEG
jgi:hypothetical protein